jgi:hypothetical protein
MRSQKEYRDGLIWVGSDNPLGLKKGYYTQNQIDKALSLHPNKAQEFYKFMEK